MAVICEGGKAIKDIKVYPISKEELYPTLFMFTHKILTPLFNLKLNDLILLGSTGKKPVNNDIDIGIDFRKFFPKMKMSEFIKNKTEKLHEIEKKVKEFSPDDYKVEHTEVTSGFSIVHFAIPIYDKEDDTGKFVQLDIMVGSIKNLEFHYFSPDEGEYVGKPALRNAFLPAIISSIRLEEKTDDEGKVTEFTRYSYSPATGIKKKTEVFRASKRNPDGEKKFYPEPSKEAIVNPDLIKGINSIFGSKIRNAKDLNDPDKIITIFVSYLESMEDEKERKRIIQRVIDKTKYNCKNSTADPEDCSDLVHKLEKVLNDKFHLLSTIKEEKGYIESLYNRKHEEIELSEEKTVDTLLSVFADATKLEKLMEDGEKYSPALVKKLLYSNGNLYEITTDRFGECFDKILLSSDKKEIKNIFTEGKDTDSIKLLSELVKSVNSGKISERKFVESVYDKVSSSPPDISSYLRDILDIVKDSMKSSYSQVKENILKFPISVRTYSVLDEAIDKEKVKEKTEIVKDHFNEDISGKVPSSEKYINIRHAYDILDQSKGKEKLTSLFNGRVLVVEKLDGVQFGIVKDREGNVNYRSKNFFLTPAQISFGPWEPLVTRLEEIRKDTDNFSFLPPDSQVVGEFIPSLTINQVAYSRFPTGSLMICDVIFGGEYQSLTTVNKVAQKLNSDTQNVIFDGIFNDKTINDIVALVTDFGGVCKEESFTDCLKTNIFKDMKPKFGNEIEGIIIKRISGGKMTAVKLVDPKFTERIRNLNTEVRKQKSIVDFFYALMESYITEARINKAFTTSESEIIPQVLEVTEKEDLTQQEKYVVFVETLFNDLNSEIFFENEDTYNEMEEGFILQPEMNKANINKLFVTKERLEGEKAKKSDLENKSECIFTDVNLLRFKWSSGFLQFLLNKLK